MPQFRPRPTLVAQRLRNNATEAERHLWRRLSRRQLRGYKFNRQMPVGPYICDFMCREAKLVIGVDGGQHDERALEDARRTAIIESQGFRVVRFWNNEVLADTDGILMRILGIIGSSPPPAPPASGREAK